MKDAADFFEAGGTAADFDAICERRAAMDTGSATAASRHPDRQRRHRGFIVRTLLAKDRRFPATPKIADAVVAELAQAGRLFHHAELRDFETAHVFSTRTESALNVSAATRFFPGFQTGWPSIVPTTFSGTFQAAVETAALSSGRAAQFCRQAYWHATPAARLSFQWRRPACALDRARPGTMRQRQRRRSIRRRPDFEAVERRGHAGGPV